MDASHRSRPPSRSRIGVIAAASILLIAGLAVLLAGWAVSPVERLSGPFGSPPAARSGAAYGRDRHQLVATGPAPVLVGGAAVMLSDGGVRAVSLSGGRTYWQLTRPGRVTAQSLWRVGDQLVAVIWSDRRLTVINVASGRHWDRDLPDQGITLPGLPTTSTSAPAAFGLAPFQGAPALVVAVQPRAVDAFEASSGTPAWSYRLPRGQAVLYPAAGARPYGAEGGTATVLLNVSTDLLGRFQETHAMVLDARGRVTLWLRSPNPAMELGGDRIGLSGANTLHVFAGLAGIPLYNLPVTDPPYATGDARLLLAENVARGTVTAYRATDGRVLWSEVFAGSGEQATPGNGIGLPGLAVYGGEARILQEYASEYDTCRPNYRLLTVDSAGEVVGIRLLPMLGCTAARVQPSLVSVGDGAVVVEDDPSPLAGPRDSYRIETG